MCFDCVVKALLSSCMSVGRSFAERLDMPCLATTAIRSLQRIKRKLCAHRLALPFFFDASGRGCDIENNLFGRC